MIINGRKLRSRLVRFVPTRPVYTPKRIGGYRLPADRCEAKGSPAVESQRGELSQFGKRSRDMTPGSFALLQTRAGVTSAPQASGVPAAGCIMQGLDCAQCPKLDRASPQLSVRSKKSSAAGVTAESLPHNPSPSRFAPIVQASLTLQGLSEPPA
jgi:hypothetical protein